ncbi:sodium/solute symporter [Haloferula sp. A504]|uniref:sodium:solute symporter family transporter n=1 Tax=Haloferula sp. A504 TaxID=3373601 RepID=UPI0031CB8CF9|nr:sodium/solute symporter [Verrucomicrobiaceae bacterium E54]
MTFGWINWGVLVAFVLGTTLLAHVLTGKARGMEGFFLGGRSLPWWAVSCSIMASQLSAVTVIAVPGAVFREGGNLLFLQGTLLGFVVAKVLMAYLFVKPYYERKIYSPYDFIEHRLGQGASQLSRGLFLVSAILGHGVRLLTIALVLSVVVEIPIGRSVLIIGVFAVLWTLMGGITTVIWTDFVLFGVMLAGAIISLVAIMGGLPFGIGEAVRQLDEAAKLKLIDVAADPAKTWTVWTGLICFAIFELAQNSVDQVITQRMMCCRDYKEARKAVLGSLGIVVFSLLMSAVGLGVWLYYQHHALDAKAAAFLAEQPSRAFPYFIVHELPVGVSGLLIAGIFAAGISTLDSALAALSETTVNGIYRKWINPKADERRCLRLSRLAVVGWGIVLSLLAYLAGRLVQDEGLLNLAYKVPVLTYGTMLMIALFALARRGSSRAILSAALLSVAAALTLLVLKGRGVISLDELYLYPITCLVFAAVAFAIKPGVRPAVSE